MKNLQKIVIIDDEMVLRNGLKYLCDWEAHGFTIAGEASNGIEGFHLIQEIRPDIVITDIVMPGMDGISLTAQIKEHFPNIHIIVLSSYDNFAYAKSSFKLGIADYLLKPELEAADLLHLLEKLSRTSGLDDFKSSASQFFQEILTFCSLEEEEYLEEFNDRGIHFKEKIPYTLMAAPYQGTIPVHRLLPAVTNLSLDGLSSPVSPVSQVRATSASFFQCSSYGTSVSCPAYRVYRSAGKRNRRRSLLFSKFLTHIALWTDVQHYCFLLMFPCFRSFPDPLRLDDARNLVYNYLSNAEAQAGMDVFTLKKQVENAIYRLIQTLADASFPTDEINSKKVMYFKKMDMSADCNSLRQVLSETFAELEDIVRKGTQEREGNLFYKIEEYIRLNCEQELKLYDLAKQFHLNYTYLSTLFYQNTEEHFSDYLNLHVLKKPRDFCEPKITPFNASVKNAAL